MTLILSGTDGLSDIDGSAATPAIRGTDTNTGIFFPAADTIAFSEGGVESVRIDSSGNVGIGTSSPATKLDVNGPASVTSFTGSTKLGVTVRGSTAATDYSGIDLIGNSQTVPVARIAVLTTGGGSSLSFGTSNNYGTGITNTAMTIDSIGNLSVGLTGTNGRASIRGETSDATKYTLFTEAQDGTDQFAVRCDGAVSMGLDGASPYNLTTSTAANATLLSDGFLYRSTSSIKYKTDIKDNPHGLAEVLQLRPVTYKGKSEADGDKVFGGLIAEEVDAIGLKEFVQYAEDGSPDALAYGNMVSLLAKAIQEQQALIQSLTARIEALEGK